ncbi:unnamed protein product, partial [Dovyalis caffra]
MPTVLLVAMSLLVVTHVDSLIATNSLLVATYTYNLVTTNYFSTITLPTTLTLINDRWMMKEFKLNSSKLRVK